jgi:hypothetical protein
MTRDMPSSDEMIRRAKETLVLDQEDFVPKVQEELAERGVSIGDVGFPTDDETLDQTMSVTPSPRTRPTSDALPARTRRVLLAGPIPPSVYHTGASTAGGRGLRIVGNILLAFVALMWVLLLIGVAGNPDDAGAAVGGGAVMTIVPLILGLSFRRAGKRRATSV